MRVLFLSPYVPSVVRARCYHWIRNLVACGHEVHLVTLRPPEDAWAPEDGLRRMCTAVEVFPLTRLRTLANALRTLPTRHPLQLGYSHHPEVERRVEQLVASGRFDVVHVEHIRGAVLARHVRSIPCVWDAVDSITRLFEQTARLAPLRRQRLLAWLDLSRTRRFEAEAPLHFSRTVVSSDADADAFEALGGPGVRQRLSVVSNGVDLDYFRPAGRPGGGRAIVFTGKLSYHANVAAALRLARNILPIVWRTKPDTPVIIAGKDPPPAIRSLAADRRVTVTGFVPDLRPVFAEAAVAVCPVVYGAGVQNKVLEAMASGISVVASETAARPLMARNGEEILVALDDAAMADAVVRLLEDLRLRQTIGEAGRAYVERAHDWRKLAQRLVDVYGVSRVVATGAV